MVELGFSLKDCSKLDTEYLFGLIFYVVSDSPIHIISSVKNRTMWNWYSYSFIDRLSTFYKIMII